MEYAQFSGLDLNGGSELNDCTVQVLDQELKLWRNHPPTIIVNTLQKAAVLQHPTSVHERPVIQRFFRHGSKTLGPLAA